jgi:tetratricopeptide (TPR) repeat protein
MKADLDPLEPDALELLLARAERDPSVSAELDFLADLAAAAERERAHLAAPPPRAVLRSRKLLAVAAAALLATLLALGAWLTTRVRAQRVELVRSEAPRYLPSELRAADARDGCFATAMEAYAGADWRAAAAALEGCLVLRPGHAPTHFYLGAALEQLGEVTRADEHYARAAEAPDALLADHARLRRAVLLAERGEADRARVELEKVLAGAGELAPNARQLLDELDER